jgi:glycosyltransferase involved in cell wall biosynthesis
MLAWNSGDLLGGAIDSILNQTVSDLELIVVDNGSTDGAIEHELTRRPDARLRVLRHERNLGIGGGTASAVPLCRSPWIAIMDSDDRSHPMRFELQLNAAKADPSLDLICTDVKLIDEKGDAMGDWPAFFSPATISGYAPYNMPFCHPTLMARAQVFRETPYRAAFRIAADFDFVARASERFKLGAVSIPLYEYRRHAASTSTSQILLSEAYVCATRLLTARRRAGRSEYLAETVAEAETLVAKQHSLSFLYTHYAARCHAEGFPLLAAFHAALSVRVRRTPLAVLHYVRYTMAAIGAHRLGWNEAAGAMFKAPFWVVLKHAGFPGFPRY